jgi:cytochrome P450
MGITDRFRTGHSGSHWMGTARVLLRTRRARDPGDVLRAVARRGRGAVGIRVRGQPVLVLLDPELAGQLLAGHAAQSTKSPGLRAARPLLGDGLLTSEGDAHQRGRRLVAPAFSPRRLASYADGFAARAEAHVSHWRDSQVVDMRQEMAGLTLDVVATTLLGIGTGGDADQIRATLAAALEIFARDGSGLPLRGRDGRWRGAARRGRGDGDTRAAAAALRADLAAIVTAIVESRRANPSDDRGDVVSALAAAAAGPDGLTTAEVHDHLITLLMAGHETTANALSWTFHLLSGNPEAERELHEELRSLGGRMPGYQDLPRLRYTKAVIAESLRIYPPAWILARSLTAAADFGGWHAPAGTIVAVSPLLLHHDARWFPDPERFDPARWLDERGKAVPRNAYLPFGTGPRACIGEQFAWAEATIVLAAVCSHWSARSVPGHLVRPAYQVTMRPGPVQPMRLESRR